MEPIRFEATIRWWDPEKAAGLAVCDVPAEHVAALGGLRQQRVRGRIGGEEFGSSVMPAGGGVLALGVTKAMMRAARLAVGDRADVEVVAVGRD